MSSCSKARQRTSELDINNNINKRKNLINVASLELKITWHKTLTRIITKIIKWTEKQATDKENICKPYIPQRNTL